MNCYFIAQHSRNQFSVVKAGDCFGKDPRNDIGYAFDDIGALSLRAKRSNRSLINNLYLSPLSVGQTSPLVMMMSTGGAVDLPQGFWVY
ncbi:MAG: hypothetical protein AYP45_01695 [Candidatus Brocadia carolinensis]|uniref:Uncharacterized protein n=1 Tax=Candidatus Brocadia carolinensis TaxID=1004156 RepID=A0A1V4AX53_9BACT|nr:MAG: hypothetical protein AYP45_01695 [Candidatus Brocadia caroliniensis]